MHITISDQACHTLALSGDENSKRDVNNEFTDVANVIGARYNYGEGMNPLELSLARVDAMNQIALLRDETAVLVDEVYLCGGFREGQVCPEHMWIEDRTNKVSYDTFIDRELVRVDGVGQEGQSFRPGCEHDAFQGDEIYRIKVPGYTAGQAAVIRAAGYELAATPEPIADGPASNHEQSLSKTLQNTLLDWSTKISDKVKELYSSNDSNKPDI